MVLSKSDRKQLPSISEISEEFLIELRDHPETDACPHCLNDQGVLIGETTAELYSIHYFSRISVYGCPHCLRIWYRSGGMELA